MSAGGHLHKLFQLASGARTVLWFVVIGTLRTSINGEGKLKIGKNKTREVILTITIT